MHPQAKQTGVVKQVMCEGNITIFAQKQQKTVQKPGGLRTSSKA
jgi:hypothetical protein